MRKKALFYTVLVMVAMLGWGYISTLYHDLIYVNFGITLLAFSYTVYNLFVLHSNMKLRK